MKHFLGLVRNALRKGRDNFYSTVRLSSSDIEKGGYKKYFGGGEKAWQSRGGFQLYFLKQMELLPSHRLLDIGCGPLRAGVHFIEYLDSGHYAGFDYNADFVEAALKVVAEKPGLSAKHPIVKRSDDFDVSGFSGKFDYAIAFSVLNHCDYEKKALFFARVPAVISPGGKIYITHARWIEEFTIPRELKVRRVLREPTDIASGLDMKTWGWDSGESIFPILEIEPSL